ncbi:DNA polymerase III subunit epsilon [Serratia symbiotica]|nr:DNA polymerase III subunit epsilon [Serratia symbiotica]
MKSTITRQIALDTETTGINKLGCHFEGHRIIEIGAVEVINRRVTGRQYHAYVKPDRMVDPAAYRVHGISDEFLADKPPFDQIADKFLDFIYGSELIIHNAAFDIGFMDYEFELVQRAIPKIETFCKITDSLAMARRLFPGKRNTLDNLCSRYKIDNNKRGLHGALIDAKLLAEVYLAMTGGQTSMTFQMKGDTHLTHSTLELQRCVRQNLTMPVVYASDTELAAHESYLDIVAQKSAICLWRTLDMK